MRVPAMTGLPIITSGFDSMWTMPKFIQFKDNCDIFCGSTFSRIQAENQTNSIGGDALLNWEMPA
jgi:hypothetical protein